jgi:hypothetical protein
VSEMKGSILADGRVTGQTMHPQRIAELYYKRTGYNLTRYCVVTEWIAFMRDGTKITGRLRRDVVADALEHEARWPYLTTAEQARDAAITWSNVQSSEPMSYGELAEWQAYFAGLARRFPELLDEFTENGIC